MEVGNISFTHSNIRSIPVNLTAFVSYMSNINCDFHDDVIKWKNFPRYWPFVRGIHRSPVNSAHKGQWRGALMFSLICLWINYWVNTREAGDLRRYRAHYDITVMSVIRFSETWLNSSTIDAYDVDGYSYVGLARESGKRGVSLFVCDKMAYYEMSELTRMCHYIECVSVKINCRVANWLLGLSTDHPIVTLLILMTLCMIYWIKCSPPLLYYGRFQSRSPKTWTTSPNRKSFMYHVC